MNTEIVKRSTAMFLGVGLVLAAGSALSAAEPKADTPNRAIPRPDIDTVPNIRRVDLATINLVSTFQGDPTKGTAKMILVGTIRNVGTAVHTQNARFVRIARKQGSNWVTVATKTVPTLTPGRTFGITYQLPAGDKSTYRLEVNNNNSEDANKNNEIFEPKAGPVEPPH